MRLSVQFKTHWLQQALPLTKLEDVLCRGTSVRPHAYGYLATPSASHDQALLKSLHLQEVLHEKYFQPDAVSQPP